MRELALFAGAGGGILGGHLLGWRTVCAVEYADGPRNVLLARQRDGILPRFPIWDDVQTFDGKPWRGRVGVVSGGFPCQDISVCGSGEGLSGEKSGLWFQMARIIREVQPELAYVENSPLLVSRGLDRVLWDLAQMGYNAAWGVLGANEVGACHKRERMWILAHNPNGFGLEAGKPRFPMLEEPTILPKSPWNFTGANGMDGMHGLLSRHAGGRDDGVADWMDRIKAVGNGQVPAVAAFAFRILAGRLLNDKRK